MKENEHVPERDEDAVPAPVPDVVAVGTEDVDTQLVSYDVISIEWDHTGTWAEGYYLDGSTLRSIDLSAGQARAIERELDRGAEYVAVERETANG